MEKEMGKIRILFWFNYIKKGLGLGNGYGFGERVWVRVAMSAPCFIFRQQIRRC